MYTIEQQERVNHLVGDIAFFSDRVTIFEVEDSRNTLKQKCDDLIEYIDSIETGKD